MGDWMDERKKREGKTDKEREEKEAAEAQRKKEEEEERAYLATVEAELGDIGSDFEDFDEDAVARKKADERKARLAAIRAKHGEPEKVGGGVSLGLPFGPKKTVFLDKSPLSIYMHIYILYILYFETFLGLFRTLGKPYAILGVGVHNIPATD